MDGILPWHRAYRPCGGCGELVLVEAGCKHWRPALAKGMEKAVHVRRRKAASDRETLYRQMGVR